MFSLLEAPFSNFSADGEQELGLGVPIQLSVGLRSLALTWGTCFHWCQIL